MKNINLLENIFNSNRVLHENQFQNKKKSNLKFKIPI